MASVTNKVQLNLIDCSSILQHIKSIQNLWKEASRFLFWKAKKILGKRTRESFLVCFKLNIPENRSIWEEASPPPPTTTTSIKGFAHGGHTHQRERERMYVKASEHVVVVSKQFKCFYFKSAKAFESKNDARSDAKQQTFSKEDLCTHLSQSG